MQSTQRHAKKEQHHFVRLCRTIDHRKGSIEVSQALYRTYRSKSLDEIVGQEHITSILRAAITAGRIAHAYLLTGPRGVGKTSIARILAHEINNLPYTDDSTHLDIIEIDAASNNGVEDVRDLRERVQIAPTQSPYKVYIIDEVHMLSKQAFNALLKTLEEPPAHVVFILATTDVDKLPATIISRVQRYNFRAATPEATCKLLRSIADKESIAIDDDALMLLAENGRGSFRDSTSLLDQMRSLSGSDTPITRSMVAAALGLADHELVSQLIDAYIAHDRRHIIELLDTHRQHGTSTTMLIEQLISEIHLRVADAPELLGLLDSLLEVAKSSRPHLKLLTTLTLPLTDTPIPPKAPLAPPAKPVKTQAKKSEKLTPHTSLTTSIDGETPQSRTASKPVATAPFDWDKLIDYTKQHSVALYGVLHKAACEYDGTTLKIYAGNGFNAKRLEDTKHRATLVRALEALGFGEIEVTISPDKKPPESSQAAAIIAMMGGGESVDVS